MVYLHAPDSTPSFRPNFPFHTHTLFSTRISTSDTSTSFFTSVSIPRHFIPPWFTYGRPLRVEGSLTVHFIGRTRLQWQLDVDRVIGQGLPALGAPASHLTIQFSPFPGEEFTDVDEGWFGEAWVIDRYTPSGISQIWSALLVYDGVILYSHLILGLVVHPKTSYPPRNPTNMSIS